MATKKSEDTTQSELAILAIVVCIFIGCLGIVFFAIQTASLAQFFSVFGVGLMIAGASVLSGGLLGFLFGIPRTLQQGKGESTPLSEQEKGLSRDIAISYQANTNLEQISDWLTKILVGVGLTQISTLPEGMQRFAEFAAPGLGALPTSKVFAVTALIFFLICGFLVSYLWTRLHLAGALRQADLATVGDKIAKMENKVSELEKQVEIDARALNVVQRQLNPTPNTPSIPVEENQAELNNAVGPASTSAKAEIFYLARSFRSENWQDRKNKPKMERTIPIFRSLIASDKEDIYHANHGQLGFALKDQIKPDWIEAESELTKAIEIRGPWNKEGWLLYEFNRAVCRINLDKAFALGKGTDEKTKQAIIADIDAAKNAPDLVEIIEGDPTISKWLALNKKSTPK